MGSKASIEKEPLKALQSFLLIKFTIIGKVYLVIVKGLILSCHNNGRKPYNVL